MDAASPQQPTILPGLRGPRPRLAEPLLGGSPRARRREALLACLALGAGLAAAAAVGAVAWFLPARPPGAGAVPAPRKGAAVAVVWESGPTEAAPLSPRLLVWSGKGHHTPGPASPVAVFANLDDAWTLDNLEDANGGIGCAWRRLARLEGGGRGGRGRRGTGAAALLAEPAPRWKAVAAAEKPPCAASGPGAVLLFSGDAQVREAGRSEDDYLADAWRLSLVGGGGGGGGGGWRPGRRRRRWWWGWWRRAPPPSPTAALWDPLLPDRARAPEPRRAAAGAIVPGPGGGTFVVAGGRPAKKGDARLGVFGDVWALRLPSSGGGGGALPSKPAWTRLFPPPGCGPAPRPHRDSAACASAWAAAPPPRKGAAAVAAPAGLVTPGPALILYGGRDDAPGQCYFSDAWAFDVSERAWVRLDGAAGAPPSAAPPGRDHAGALLDARSVPPRLLVYGGRGGANYSSSVPLPLDEVWELPLSAAGGAPAAWSVRPRPCVDDGRPPPPPPRFLFGYDSFTSANETYGVVFGGEGESGALYGDAWRYSAGPAGVSTDLDLTQCTLAEALTAARLCSLAPEVAAELERRPRLPPSTLTTPGRLGPRAEAAAIAALLKELDETRVSPGSPEAEAVAALRAGAVSAAAQAGAAPRTAVTADTASAPLMAWAASAGIESSAIVPALFDAGGASSSRRLMRGAAAARPIAPGDAFLAVPAAALITPAAAAGTDLGRALWSLPGVSPDDALLAWTLVDAADAGSARAPVWAALRAAPVCTGLTVSEAAASVLDGTPAGARLRAARAHVRAAFEASAPLFTALAAAVDDPASAFSWRAYAWAASAWYAFAMEVVEGGGDGEGEGGGGSLADATPALVPVAFLLNHEARHPTAVRYGVLEAAAGSGGGRAMRVRACAPAAPGEEVTLSYGPRSNADLLIFYGFSVQDNPDDSLHLEVGGAQLAVPARDVLGPSPLGPGPDLVAAGGPEVRAAARAAVSAFEAAAARARAAEVEEADAGWVESARVYCEGGAALARAVAEAV